MKKPNIRALNAEDSANYWKKKYQKLEEEFEQYKKESIKWGVLDFLDLQVEGYSIDEDQAQEALEEMIDDHDCNNGITWDTLEYYIEKHGTKVEKGKESWRKYHEHED